MNRMLKFGGLVIVTIMSLVSCSRSNSNDDVSGSQYSKTYITGYLIPEALTADSSGSCVGFTIGGDVLTQGEIFDELSKANNDTSYNRYNVSGPRIAIGENISSMRVVALDNFDSNHQSGSDISDLIECQYISYYDYVQSGYQNQEKSVDDYKDCMEYYSIDGAKLYRETLADIEFANINLCAPYLILKFKAEPENKGTHQFKLILVTQTREIDITYSYEF